VKAQRTLFTVATSACCQHTQNRDTRALQLKLDELIRSTAGARPQLMNLEELDDDQLEALKHEFERLSERKNRPSR